MKLIVTDKGPIDRRPVGSDVTGLYDEETAARLIAEGYLIDQDAKPAPRRTRKKVDDDGDQ